MRKQLLGSLFVSILILSQSLTLTEAQSNPSYLITGRVEDMDGKRVAGIKVCAKPENHRLRSGLICGISDATGRFAFGSYEAGKYELFADNIAEGYPPQILPFYADPVIGVVPEVLLDEVNKRAEVLVRLGQKAGEVSGKITDSATGLPLENSRILMCHADKPGVCFGMSAKDSKGKFTLLAPYVPFVLKITAEGFEDWNGQMGSDAAGSSITLASDDRMELSVNLKRRADAVSRAISESEKIKGVHLSAPEPLSPADNSTFNHYPRTTKLKWSPVDGAVAYRVEVDYCTSGRKDRRECINPQPLVLPTYPQLMNLTETRYEFTFVGAQPGRWRVWAVDKEGHEGFKSPWQKFVYLK